jgi:hypothetical protein
MGIVLGNRGQLGEALSLFEKAVQLGDAESAQYAAQAGDMLGRQAP